MLRVNLPDQEQDLQFYHPIGSLVIAMAYFVEMTAPPVGNALELEDLLRGIKDLAIRCRNQLDQNTIDHTPRDRPVFRQIRQEFIERFSQYLKLENSNDENEVMQKIGDHLMSLVLIHPDFLQLPKDSVNRGPKQKYVHERRYITFQFFKSVTFRPSNISPFIDLSNREMLRQFRDWLEIKDEGSRLAYWQGWFKNYAMLNVDDRVVLNSLSRVTKLEKAECHKWFETISNHFNSINQNDLSEWYNLHIRNIPESP